MDSNSAEASLLETLTAIHTAGIDLRERATSQALESWSPAELSFLHECLRHPQSEARILAVQQLAYKWASNAKTADALVTVAMSDENRWVRYAAMSSLRQHHGFENAQAARISARASSDRLMKLAERAGTDSFSPELENQFRKSLAKSPDSDPIELGLELARSVWPDLLLRWRSLNREKILSDRRGIENELLAKKDVLRYSSEALFIAEGHLDGKPQAHVLLINPRDPASFHEEDPLVSILVPSLEHFGHAYGLGGGGSSFKRYVGLVNLFWPILRKHSSFIAGARGKRTILVGVHHPEDPVPVLGTIDRARGAKS